MAIYTSVEEGISDLVPLSNKMVRSPQYFKKEEMRVLKKWVDSIVKEKGERTTFVYNRKYIEIMIETSGPNFTGSLVGNWHIGTGAGDYGTELINRRSGWLQGFRNRNNRPKGLIIDSRGGILVTS
jgi:hypothetical protein